MKQTIAWQLNVCPELPQIQGSVEFTEFQNQLHSIDQQLKQYKLEKTLIANSVETLEKKRGQALSPKHRAHLIRQRSIALRCNLARRLLGSSYRRFHLDLAQSWVMQSFVGILSTQTITVPTKSQLERFEKWFSDEDLEDAMRNHVQAVLDDHVMSGPGQEEAVTLDHVYADSTCIQAHIHHPVDWVLLRDAGRSLLTTIQTIRRHGLRHRMPNPKRLLNHLNRLSMTMTQARRQKGARKKRKQLLRTMKRLLKTIAEHGQRYVTLLHDVWSGGIISRGKTSFFAERLASLLAKVPHVLRQAHERIIGERKVENSGKLLSLYEDHVHVIVRGKANAEVEFGNGLYLAEQDQGLLVDWKFHRDQPPPDSKQVEDSIKRLQTYYPGHSVKAFSTDRGFDSKANAHFLEKHQIYNGICPKSPVQLSERLKDTRFQSLQHRRAQTEARVGIIRNVFLNGVIRSKRFAHRKLTVLWSIFCHNVWLVSRLKEQTASIE